MLKDMNSVFDNAEETAKKYHARMEAEREAREAAAKDIVAGLGGHSGSDIDGDLVLLLIRSSQSSLQSSPTLRRGGASE